MTECVYVSSIIYLWRWFWIKVMRLCHWEGMTVQTGAGIWRKSSLERLLSALDRAIKTSARQPVITRRVWASLITFHWFRASQLSTLFLKDFTIRLIRRYIRNCFNNSGASLKCKQSNVTDHSRRKSRCHQAQNWPGSWYEEMHWHN